MRRQRQPLSSLPEEANINLTPLIDVVFVVLIMFIVVAPLLDVDKIDLAARAPSSESASMHQKSPVAIYVYGDNTLTFNQESINLKDLPKYLQRAKKIYPNAPVELYHDREASFGTYQSIKSATESAGFQELLVILKP